MESDVKFQQMKMTIELFLNSRLGSLPRNLSSGCAGCRQDKQIFTLGSLVQEFYQKNSREILPKIFNIVQKFSSSEQECYCCSPLCEILMQKQMSDQELKYVFTEIFYIWVCRMKNRG